MCEVPEDGIDVPKHIGLVEGYGCVCHTRSNTRVERLILKLGNQQWEEKNEQTVFGHEVCTHSVTGFIWFSLLSSSGFSTYVLLVGKCQIQKVSNKFNIRFLVKIKKNLI